MQNLAASHSLCNAAYYLEILDGDYPLKKLTNDSEIVNFLQP